MFLPSFRNPRDIGTDAAAAPSGVKKYRNWTDEKRDFQGSSSFHFLSELWIHNLHFFLYLHHRLLMFLPYSCSALYSFNAFLLIYGNESTEYTAKRGVLTDDVSLFVNSLALLTTAYPKSACFNIPSLSGIFWTIVSAVKKLASVNQTNECFLELC